MSQGGHFPFGTVNDFVLTIVYWQHTNTLSHTLSLTYTHTLTQIHSYIHTHSLAHIYRQGGSGGIYVG